MTEDHPTLYYCNEETGEKPDLTIGDWRAYLEIDVKVCFRNSMENGDADECMGPPVEVAADMMAYSSLIEQYFPEPFDHDYNSFVQREIAAIVQRLQEHEINHNGYKRLPF